MKKTIRRILLGCLALASLDTGAAVDFRTVAKYATACESELGFAAADVPSLNCNDGLVFNNVNDSVGHARLEPFVDLVFACRHVSTAGDTAVSIELLIHNRQSGSTCFFAAKDSRANPPANTDAVISTDIVSPTASNADSYWKTFPFRCVDCHVAGPYIASPTIAPALAQFGLLNDGHDTLPAPFAIFYHSVGSVPVGTNAGIPSVQNPFTDWDAIVKGKIVASCADACHAIGSKRPVSAILDAEGNILIPSLSNDIDAIANAQVMPANNPPNTAVDNSYRWVNMDIPDGRGDYEESETLSNLAAMYPLFYCTNPTSLSAHVIDSDEIINTSDAPDNLNRFNLQDGLVCLNKDQPSGRCNNYQTRYLCNGRWTAWQDNDDPSYSGDWEPRHGFKNLCAAPVAIQARYKPGSKWIIFNGPPDRLVQFDSRGLVCHNADQNNLQCSNYVVRFECPQ